MTENSEKNSQNSSKSLCREILVYLMVMGILQEIERKIGKAIIQHVGKPRESTENNQKHSIINLFFFISHKTMKLQ